MIPVNSYNPHVKMLDATIISMSADKLRAQVTLPGGITRHIRRVDKGSIWMGQHPLRDCHPELGPDLVRFTIKGGK